MKYTPSYRDVYSALFDDTVLTDEIVEEQKSYYEANKSNLADGLEKHTRVIDLNDSQVRGVIVPGESPESIIIGGEYGNANTLPAYVRAMGIRAIVSPESSLILLPNNTFGENNLGFTPQERQEITKGNAEPYTYRFKKLLDRANTPVDQATHVVGMSLGATTGAAFAAEGDVNTRSLTLIEPPHLSGSIPSIMTKFVTSGGQLDLNVEMSRQGIEDFDTISDSGVLSIVKFGLGSLSKDNLASLSLLRNRDIEYDIMWAQDVHHGIGIVNAYGTEAHVSPTKANRILAKRRKSDSFQSFELTGADHSVTNAHAVVAALAKRAKELSDR